MVFNAWQEKTHFSCEDGIEKLVPCNHCWSLLDKPHDAIWWSLGQIFLSDPHTHERLLFGFSVFGFISQAHTQLAVYSWSSQRRLILHQFCFTLYSKCPFMCISPIVFGFLAVLYLEYLTILVQIMWQIMSDNKLNKITKQKQQNNALL